jgi:tetratricopeptide (TPR) repeat protein
VADDEVVIVEEDEGQTSLDSSAATEEAAEKAPSEDTQKAGLKKKLMLYGIPAFAVLILIVAVTLIVLNRPKGEKVEVNASEAPKIKPGAKPKITASELEQLIEKAKALYESGDKESALKLYGEISVYSESVSNYNLGVAKMGEGDYKGAVNYFQNSIKAADNELPSAINSAVCMYKMGDRKKAKEYISLAKASLPKYVNSPLYSYYYSLISYYEGNYYEALSAVSAPTGKFFAHESSEIAKRAYLLFDDGIDMLEILKKEKNKDYLSIGFLQAREGKYKEAIDALESAKKNEPDKLKALMAQSLVYLKANMPLQASNTLKESMLISEAQASRIFDIQLFLKPTAFRSDMIQDKLLNEFISNPKTVASIMFYYAPYKVFNPNKTVSSIKKGEAGLMVDDITAGVGYLENAAKQSKINAEMVRGIDYAVSGRVYLANKLFKALEPKYPTHAVLLYNLGLTYAQSGDFKEAHKYFVRAYNFDPKNYEAGIFSIITSKIVGVPFDRTKESLEADLFAGGSFANKSEYAAMFSFALDNSVATIDWLMNTPKKNAMSLAIGTLISLKLDKRNAAIASAKALSQMLPKDIVAGGLYLFVKNSGENVKFFARETQAYLGKGYYDINSVFYGPDLAKDMFVSLHRVSGLLTRAKDIYERRIKIENNDRAQLLKGYGAVLMYLKMFKEANAAYSTVVLDIDYVNAHTLFMAGASAIASSKNSDAISFFELAKLYDPTSLESVYALGLLYLEAANINQSATQFKMIKGVFESEFFDFDIR